MKLRTATAVVLIGTLTLASALLATWRHTRTDTYVAYFANTNGLYTGDEVRVLVDDPDDRLRLGQPATVALGKDAAK